ncbi:hypothetical protein Kisp01_00300 [Kineosporia sp. NBRC 101677]|nr:hypothetical protein Kisp01_00300 [Kineosporia sp. NBRC 101677]
MLEAHEKGLRADHRAPSPAREDRYPEPWRITLEGAWPDVNRFWHTGLRRSCPLLWTKLWKNDPALRSAPAHRPDIARKGKS